jgi:hypothetical protein
MSSLLRIDGDPTTWRVSTTIGSMSSSSGPVPLDVNEPLVGTLLLSPRAMGSAVILPQPLDGHEHAPNGVILPGQAWLYVPSTAGPDPLSSPQRLYLLSPAKSIGEVRDEIIAAMSKGAFVTIGLAKVAAPGTVVSPEPYGSIVLNCGALPFVVLCTSPATS